MLIGPLRPMTYRSERAPFESHAICGAHCRALASPWFLAIQARFT